MWFFTCQDEHVLNALSKLPGRIILSEVLLMPLGLNRCHCTV